MEFYMGRTLCNMMINTNIHRVCSRALYEVHMCVRACVCACSCVRACVCVLVAFLSVSFLLFKLSLSNDSLNITDGA